MRETDSCQTTTHEGQEGLARLTELERENRKLRREIGHLKEALTQEKIARATALNRQKISTFLQRERDRYLALLLANSPSIILFLNNTGRIEFCTDYFVGKAGLKHAADVTGHTLTEVLSGFLDDASLEALLKRSESVTRINAPIAFDIAFCFNGERGLEAAKEDFAGLLVPMKDEQEHCNGVMLMLHDVTDLKRSREDALQASRAKSDFLSNMSHEIRTPMNAIIGMTELALLEVISDAARDDMLTVKQAAMNLLVIINDILDISKIERGKLKIEPGDYALESLINDVVNLIRVRISDKPVHFLVRVDSRIPNSLIGDETKMRQILMNLLGNAAKFTEAGFVSLALTGEVVDGDTIDLIAEVSDSGVGIKQEDVENIFDAYTQVRQRKGVQTEGTGLGLAITKGIVSAMGGRISVVSEYGKGSTFTVSVPQKIHSRDALASVVNPDEKSVLIYGCRKEYDESLLYALKNLGVRCANVSDDAGFYDALISGQWPIVFVGVERYEDVRRVYAETKCDARTVLLAEYGDSIPGQKLTVLYMPAYSVSVANLLNGVSDRSYNVSEESAAVFTTPDAKVLLVDDIETNLKVAEGLLRPYKIKADLCKSGEAAIEAVQKMRYDLVFMDHKMPGMDGIETVGHIRAMGSADPYYEKLPIIALTANAVSGMEKLFMENGFSGFLSKPINLTKLDAVLKKWIGVKHETLTGEDQSAAAKVSGGDTDIHIEGVNVGKGVALLGGDVGLYMETLSVFHQDGLEKIEEIAASLKSGDLHLFSVHAHALKSACANIGAGELSAAAKALEAAGDRGDLQYIDARTGDFVSSLSLLLERVNGAVIKYNEEKKSGDAFDMEAFMSGLAELKAAIAEMDAAAMNHAARSIQSLARSEETGALAASIHDSLLMAEYDEAILLIDSFFTKQRAHDLMTFR